jgi:hypothetical protein
LQIESLEVWKKSGSFTEQISDVMLGGAKKVCWQTLATRLLANSRSDHLSVQAVKT